MLYRSGVRVLPVYSRDAQRPVYTARGVYSFSERCITNISLVPLIEYIDEWICIMQTTPAKPPKLLDQVRERLRLKHYSIRT